MRCKAFFTILLLAAISSLAIVPVPAFGATTTNQMQVSAIILDRGHCSFETPGPYLINFNPALNPFAPVERNASVTFRVRCRGIGHGGSTVIVTRSEFNQLYLEKDSDTIPYNLNLPTSRPVTNNTPVDITVTATIPANSYSNAPAGSYNDTITINIEP
ncbi:MAG TPA: hypothetical protein PK036_08260 [Geobacteraceae bacterium]|nr:hypothetical protein [Geobacteraceae bacterium]